MSEWMVEVDGLGKAYPTPEGGEHRAVRDLAFRCRAGEVFGLLGLNGAGKTTTLRMLSTAIRPTEGSARVHGHDVAREPREVRASIGFLSGTTGLYHRLTAREMVHYFGELHGMSGHTLDARVEEVLGAFGASEFADTRCERLSSGMKQKVNLARTVVHDPPVLILDEPTTALDVLSAAATLDFVEQMRDRGRCVLFSTHVLSEVERVCDRIGVIHGGTLRAVGTADELRQQTGQPHLEEAFRQLVGAR